MDGSMIGVNEE